MAVIRQPRTAFSLSVSPQAISAITAQRVLFIGQQVTDTSVDGQLVKNIGVNGEESVLFGEQCYLSEMIRQFRAINTVTTIDAIPYNDDGSAVAPTGIVTLTGSATESGTVTLHIQDKNKYVFTVSVASGDSSNDVMTALISEINANTEVLVTAILDIGNNEIDLTAVNGGTTLNEISLELDCDIAGLTYAVTGMSGGTTDPDVSGFGSLIENIRYQTVVAPYFARADVQSVLDARFNVTGEISDGVGFVGTTATPTNVKADALALNSNSMTIICSKIVNASDSGGVYRTGAALFNLGVSVCSQFVADRTKKFTPGQNISSILVGSAGSGNNFGGPWLAAVPYHNTPFPNLSIIESEFGWTQSEQDNLNDNGVMFLGNNSSLTGIISGDAVTTYLTNAQGQSDTSWKYLNIVDTASTIREYFYNENKSQYAQTVMTLGDVIPNVNQVNPQSYTAFQIGLYSTLATDQNYALCQAGQIALDFFKDNLSVSFDTVEGKITTIMKVPIVSQVRTIDGSIEINFDTSTA